MVRFLALGVLALLVFLLLRATLRAFADGLRGRAAAPARRRASLDELVRDPACETYIPRRKAIPRTVGGETRYFCSAACADRFAARS